jgi:hypothetical protein
VTGTSPYTTNVISPKPQLFPEISIADIFFPGTNMPVLRDIPDHIGNAGDISSNKDVIILSNSEYCLGVYSLIPFALLGRDEATHGHRGNCVDFKCYVCHKEGII